MPYPPTSAPTPALPKLTDQYRFELLEPTNAHYDHSVREKKTTKTLPSPKGHIQVSVASTIAFLVFGTV